MIPLSEQHLGRILAEWVIHYNQGCSHLSLGPGIPEPAEILFRKVTADILWPKTARSQLMPSWAASITNTAGKGSPREGQTTKKTPPP
jgi:hypothetical protein